MRVHLNTDMYFDNTMKFSISNTHPQEVRDGREDRNDVIVNGRLPTEQVVEEVEHPGVDPDVGQTDVEDHVDDEGEEDAGDQGETPGPGLEPELEVHNSDHSGVDTEPETELTQGV